MEVCTGRQGYVATASAISELLALNRAGATTILIAQCLGQIGIKLQGVAGTDSSAAKGIAHRVGSGRVRHLRIEDLWIQERVRERDLIVTKLDTEVNRGDIGTKYFDANRIEKLLSLMGLVTRGREIRTIAALSSVSRASSWVATLVAAHLLQPTGGVQVDVQVSVPEVGWLHSIIVVHIAVCAFLSGMLACRRSSSEPDDIAIGRAMGDGSSRASDAGESTAWDVLSDTSREQPGEDAAEPPPPGPVGWVAERQGVPPAHGDGPRRRRPAPRIAEA